MKHTLCLWLSLLLLSSSLYAEATKRIKQINNDKVAVWKTVIYPSTQKKLVLHRHEHDRVVIALTDGRLKVTNNQGKTHYWTLEKNKAYYLSRDPINELHSDENMTNHVIKVMVVELKNS